MRRLVVGICVAIAACGRAGFDPIYTDGPPDVGSDCWSAWTTGPLRLTTPRRVTELATTTAHGDPWLSPDALTMYFSRGDGPKDYYVTRRTDRSSPWGVPTRVDDLSSSDDDTKLTLTDDGLVALLSSDRTPSAAFDLWEARRASTANAFGTATRAPFAAINNNSSQYDPHISGDGLRLYYAPDIGGRQAIHVATRSSRTAEFGAPVPVALAHMYNADPAVSPDELVMIYASTDNGPTAMFYASRTGIAGTFTGGDKLPIYEVAVHDQDPAISYDGCELYFVSLRGGPDNQLYVTFVR